MGVEGCRRMVDAIDTAVLGRPAADRTATSRSDHATTRPRYGATTILP